MSEIENHLNKSKIYQVFKEKAIQEGDVIEAQVTSILLEGVSDAYEKSKLIIKYMPEYTLHDGTHLFRFI
jgi:molecular chaperone HtpG